MAESIKILHTQEEICNQGCEFFIQANPTHDTRFSSAYLRWLSARKKGGEPYSSSQQKAAEYINEIAQNEYAAQLEELSSLHVLLYKDPTNDKEFNAKDMNSTEYVKMMLKAGADIRYCETDNPIRLAIQDNNLLLSWSSSDNDRDTPLSKKTVNQGMYYTGVPNNDPLINYYTKYFDRLFDKAKKVKLNQKGEIKDTDSKIRSIVNYCKTNKGQIWFDVILSVIFLILGYLIS